MLTTNKQNHKQFTTEQDIDRPLLAIVIPTARYSPHLVKFISYFRHVCLENDLEIIIVSTIDNPANKLYRKLCEIEGCKLLILERQPGEDMRSKQMNIGVLHCSAEYVYIVADDMFASCSLLSSLRKILQERKPDAVLHATLPYPVSIWARVRMIEKIFSSYNLYQSSCRIIRKDVFVKLEGYREDLVVGEDIEFQDRLLKLKPRLAIIPIQEGFEIHLGEYMSLSSYIRRACYYGKYLTRLARVISKSRFFHSYVVAPSSIPQLVRIFRLYALPYAVYKVVMAMATICGRLSEILSYSRNRVKVEKYCAKYKNLI